ncbi:MAG: EAL domain-containing protein [Lachnospiraceae bacterium]|nr:EAL domain-containing protein [Lachnospiraceae bacterium]
MLRECNMANMKEDKLRNLKKSYTEGAMVVFFILSAILICALYFKPTYSVALIIVLILFMIVFFCNNIRKRKQMTEVFFMDETTGKHNWMWFLSNAEKELNNRRNYNTRFAVLDIVFVNYRNFCVCHSVKEGEKMLRLVDDTISRRIGKGEMVAHHSAAHFAALLIFDTKEILEKRIHNIIKELERIDTDHKFSFWVGVDMVTTRRNVDIEKEYNNAGAARATLSGDDSAIAFFDEKIVEEQKWMDTINENQQKALDNEEFVVYYQPKYDPGTEELKGAEALIRWNSPEHGLISPGRFIPIFESNGFITKIDHYIEYRLRHDIADKNPDAFDGCCQMNRHGIQQPCGQPEADDGEFIRSSLAKLCMCSVNQVAGNQIGSRVDDLGGEEE